MTEEAERRWTAFKGWYERYGAMGTSWSCVRKSIPKTKAYFETPRKNPCTVDLSVRPEESVLEWYKPEDLRPLVEHSGKEEVGDSGYFGSAIHYYIAWLKHFSDHKNLWDGETWVDECCGKTYRNLAKRGCVIAGCETVVSDSVGSDFDEEGVDPDLNKYLKMLERSRQLIFTGAPGTGKTFLAQQLALSETGDDPSACVHVKFVQFHPSYDYSDFVEGLRPYENENREIGFRRTDGVFMELCRNAAMDEDKTQAYVMVVDEINRGNLSKIFGELFFALESDYRGEVKGRVKTRYNNLLPENDIFKDGFYVPENVYLIGTMNDIDRGVESIDFAIRRRFAWEEILPDDRFKQMMAAAKLEPDVLKNAGNAMQAINKIISEHDLLGPAYCIGPAYFRKLQEDEYNGNFDELWHGSLEPLIREYLRGETDAAAVVGRIKSAYDAEIKGTELDEDAATVDEESTPNVELSDPDRT